MQDYQCPSLPLDGRAGVGPSPVPIYQLTSRDLVDAIRVLQTEATRNAAKRVGARLRQIDGLGTATQHMYRGLVADAQSTVM